MRYHFTCKDADGEQFKVGYRKYQINKTSQPLFYLESKLEQITLPLTPAQLRELIVKMEKLCTTMEQMK